MMDTLYKHSRLPGIDMDLTAAMQKSLHAWYDENKRDLPWRQTRDPYAIWISEAMLQQTQVKTVIPYYRRFLDQFPNAACLAAAERQSVYKIWEGLGYYSRARHLHQAAGIITTQMNGCLPHDPKTLQSLPGIGPYIAAAVLSIAFNQPFAVVDGNVKRVLARLFLLETPANGTSHTDFQILADLLLFNTDPGRHNQAVMELGALICTPRNPRCLQCPLALYCNASRQNLTAQYPRRLKRPSLPHQHWVAGVVLKNDRILLTRRPANGLLGGLWEFPCITISPNEDPALACFDAIHNTVGLKTDHPLHITTIHHTYTHFKLRMDLYLCQFLQGRIRLKGPDAFKWIHPSHTNKLPLHKAVLKSLPALEKTLCHQK